MIPELQEWKSGSWIYKEHYMLGHTINRKKCIPTEYKQNTKWNTSFTPILQDYNIILYIVLLYSLKTHKKFESIRY